jgi:formylglycine-generating enzyme required for sulfatase activity
VNALLPARKKDAAALAEKYSQAYAGSVLIGEALSHRHSVLVEELETEKKIRAFRINQVVALVVLSAFIAVPVVLSQNEKAERAERERVVVAKRAEEERIAAVERAERERVVAAEVKERQSKIVADAIKDNEGRFSVSIPRGDFEMGFVKDSDAPLHSVNVSPFFLGQTEVTYGEWKSVSEWAKERGYGFGNKGLFVSDKHPVTNVSWYDAVKWCNAKSEFEGLSPCYTVDGSVYRKGENSSVSCNWNASGYRLPTEAEWEKAARGGLVSKRYPNGDDLSEYDANFSRTQTRWVKSYEMNSYGLYDMAGNVWEWCWDWYGNGIAGESNDPKGPDSGDRRVVRGGSWLVERERCSVFFRHSIHPAFDNGEVGFRLVRRSDL